jgi:uracil-DNA glycosylase
MSRIEEAERSSRHEALAALQEEMRDCRRCLEAGYPIVPGAVFSGPASASVMVVGQAPGVTETAVGRPFNGLSGRRLFEWLARAGWEEEAFREAQYMSAVTKCYTGKGKGDKGDRVPTRAEQRLCAPFLERELALVRPKLLLPVGGLAVRRFLGSRAKRLGDVVGEAFASDDGSWIVPLPHPSGASLWLNRPENRARVDRALEHVRRLCEELCIC